MESTEKPEQAAKDLFRSEAVNALKNEEFARAQIARPWGVRAIAVGTLPILALLLGVMTTYSYEVASFSKGAVRNAVAAPCKANRADELVGVLQVDEQRLRLLFEGSTVPLQAPAISPQVFPATVVCIAEPARSPETGGIDGQFEVVVSLDRLQPLAKRQPLRAGMTISALTQQSEVKLWKLFIKDDANAR